MYYWKLAITSSYGEEYMRRKFANVWHLVLRRTDHLNSLQVFVVSIYEFSFTNVLSSCESRILDISCMVYLSEKMSHLCKINMEK